MEPSDIVSQFGTLLWVKTQTMQQKRGDSERGHEASRICGKIFMRGPSVWAWVEILHTSTNSSTDLLFDKYLPTHLQIFCLTNTSLLCIKLCDDRLLWETRRSSPRAHPSYADNYKKNYVLCAKPIKPTVVSATGLLLIFLRRRLYWAHSVSFTMFASGLEPCFSFVVVAAACGSGAG